MYRIPLKRHSDKPIVQLRTAVVGAADGCGASFVAGSLALSAAKEGGCTLAELGTPYFFNALNISRRFAEGNFVFYEDELMNRRSLFAVRNMYRNVDLLLRSPDSSGPLPGICVCRMPGDNVVFDLSGASDSFLEEVLVEMDRIFIVIDPLPSKLIPGAERAARLRLLFPDSIFVVNKMNSGVHRSELKRFLGVREYAEIPFIDPALMYGAEYSCIFPAEIKEVSIHLDPFTQKTQFNI